MNDDALKTMSVPEAGKLLGLGKNGSYAAAGRGEIPVLRFGSRLRVPVVAFDRMLAQAGSKSSALDTASATGAFHKEAAK